MVGKSSSVMKYFLFTFNLIFILSSIILMCVGLVIQAEYHRYRNFLDGHYFSAPSLLLCISIVLIIVTFLGCCGAIQENYCMIMMFSIMMAILLILEICGGIAGFTLSERAHSVLQTNLNDTMQLYNKSVELTHVWDRLQENLSCCGVNEYIDWYPVLNNSLPMSCCHSQSGAVGMGICNETMSTLYHTPCLVVLTDIIKDNALILGAVGIGIALTQIIGILFACSLARTVRNEYEMFI